MNYFSLKDKLMPLRLLLLLLISFLSNQFFAQTTDSLILTTVEEAEYYRLEEANYSKAIDILESLLATYKISPKLTSLVHRKLGTNYYYYGNSETAYIHAKHALEIQTASSNIENIDLVRTLFLCAAINKDLEHYNAANNEIAKAIKLMEKLVSNKENQNFTLLTLIYNEYTRLNTILKNNALAMRYWDKSYRFYSKQPAQHYVTLKTLFAEKGHILFNQKKYAQAISAYQQAIDIYKKYETDLSYYPYDLEEVYTSIGFMYLKLGNYTQANAYYLKSLAFIQQWLADEETPYVYQSLGLCYNNLFELEGLRQNYEQAEIYYQESLEYTLKGWGNDYNSSLALVYRDRANIAIAQQQIDYALELNTQALQALIPSLHTLDASTIIDLTQHPINDKFAVLETLQQRADILTILSENTTEQYSLTIYEHYQTLDLLISQIRKSYNAAGSQFDLIEQSTPIYEKAIAFSLKLYENNNKKEYLERAYQFAAKNKALVLLGGIQEENAKNNSSIPPHTQAEEQRLKKAIYALEGEIYDLGQNSRDSQRDSLFQFQRAYEQLISSLEDSYDDYYNSKYGLDHNMAVQSIQKKLSKQQAVLEFFVGAQNLYTFFITKDQFGYTQLKKTTKLEQQIIDFRHDLANKTALDANFKNSSHLIYQQLLEPTLNKLATNTKELMIVLDPLLMQLPFDALIRDTSAKTPAYLLKDYSISYAYSNRLLFANKAQNRAPNVFAGFGLNYDDYTLSALNEYIGEPNFIASASRALGKLQYAEEEINTLTKLLNGHQWLNDQATKAAFLQAAEQYSIIHLAAHGVLSENHPLNSALVFSKTTDSTDFLLRAADLYNMKLNADMVVLSACNTGSGKIQKGEGVRSLARAFSHAGCPSLVASLWSASDQSTKELVVDFYTNLETGLSKAEALRQAKLNYLASSSPAYQLPYYWSHLNIIGDNAPLEVFEKDYKYSYIALAAALALVLFFWKRRN